MDEVVGSSGASADAETGSREPGLASRPGPSGFDPARVAEAISPNMRHLHYVDIEDVLDTAAGHITAHLKSAFMAGWLTRHHRSDVAPEEAWLTYLDSQETKQDE